MGGIGAYVKKQLSWKVRNLNSMCLRSTSDGFLSLYRALSKLTTTRFGKIFSTSSSFISPTCPFLPPSPFPINPALPHSSKVVVRGLNFEVSAEINIFLLALRLRKPRGEMEMKTQHFSRCRDKLCSTCQSCAVAPPTMYTTTTAEGF